MGSRGDARPPVFRVHSVFHPWPKFCFRIHPFLGTEPAQTKFLTVRDLISPSTTASLENARLHFARLSSCRHGQKTRPPAPANRKANLSHGWNTDETRVTREAREIREPEGGAMRTSRPTQVGRDLRARRSFVHSRHSRVSRAKLFRVPSVAAHPASRILPSAFPL